MGAAIAYYTIFSLAPLLLLVIAAAGMVFGREAVQGEIAVQITGLIGKEGAAAIEALIASASKPATSTMATVISLALLILGATSVFAEIQNAMDRIWKIPASQRPGSAFDFVRTRVLSFGLILGLAFLLLVSLVVSAGVAALGSWWGTHLKGWEAVLQTLNMGSSLFFSTLLFGMIYKLLPRPTIVWRDVWTGAVITAALFEIGKFAIGLYLGKSGVTSAFGAAGSVVILLIWVYYSAQIFLLGAEFTRQYSLMRHPEAALAPATSSDALVSDREPQSNAPRAPEARDDVRYPNGIAPYSAPPMYFSSRVEPISAVGGTPADKEGKMATAVGLSGQGAIPPRAESGRRGLLSLPALGAIAAVGLLAILMLKKMRTSRQSDVSMPEQSAFINAS